MTMTPKATTWWPPDSAGLSTAGSDAASRTVAMLLVPPEKPRGPEHEDDGHDHEDDQVGAHERVDLVDGRRQHACDAREGDAEAVRERHHARDVDAEGLHEGGILGGGPQVRAQLRPLDDVPGAEAQSQR